MSTNEIRKTFHIKEKIWQRGFYDCIVRSPDDLIRIAEYILSDPSRSGLVDDPELQFLLAKAGAHFRIIRMAYNKKLIGETERFKDYVYPRELNTKINEKINKLEKQLKELDLQ